MCVSVCVQTEGICVCLHPKAITQIVRSPYLFVSFMHTHTHTRICQGGTWDSAVRQMSSSWFRCCDQITVWDHNLQIYLFRGKQGWNIVWMNERERDFKAHRILKHMEWTLKITIILTCLCLGSLPYLVGFTLWETWICIKTILSQSIR